MVGEQHYLTAEGRKELEEELHRLKTIERPLIAQRIHKAHGTGGNVDNAEYEEVKEEQSFIEGRIQDIDRTLINSITAPSHDPKGGTVDFGSTVTVKPARAEPRRTCSLAAPRPSRSRAGSPMSRLWVRPLWVTRWETPWRSRRRPA